MYVGTNAAEFGAGIEAEVEAVELLSGELVRAVALYGLRNLLFLTRVDTGRARGNWQVTEGRPATGTVERLDVSGKKGDANVFEEESANVRALSGEEVIWYHNGLAYIRILEDLDKMVEGTYAAAETFVQGLGARVR